MDRIDDFPAPHLPIKSTYIYIYIHVDEWEGRTFRSGALQLVHTHFFRSFQKWHVGLRRLIARDGEQYYNKKKKSGLK